MTWENFRQKGAAKRGLWDRATPSVPLQRRDSVWDLPSDSIREKPLLAAPEWAQFQSVKLQCCKKRMRKQLKKSLPVTNIQSRDLLKHSIRHEQTSSMCHYLAASLMGGLGWYNKVKSWAASWFLRVHVRGISPWIIFCVIRFLFYLVQQINKRIPKHVCRIMEGNVKGFKYEQSVYFM